MNALTALSGRVPLVTRTIAGEPVKTIAAIPTATPGLFVHWSTKFRSYALSTSRGLRIAAGWQWPDDARAAASELAGFADWVTASREDVDGMPYRHVREIGTIIDTNGGQFHATLPGTWEAAQLRDLRQAKWRLDAEVEELQETLDSLPAAEVARLTALVAAMHAAAVGETKTPLLGLVDDVASTRSSFLAQQNRAETLDGIARELAARVAELEAAAALRDLCAKLVKEWGAEQDAELLKSDQFRDADGHAYQRGATLERCGEDLAIVLEHGKMPDWYDAGAGERE